jgi:hypothetical protein
MARQVRNARPDPAAPDVDQSESEKKAYDEISVKKEPL